LTRRRAMPKKPPLYPHMPKSKQRVGGGIVRIDYDEILSNLDYFIKDEQKAAIEYRNFAEKMHTMSVMEGYSEIQSIARDEDKHKAKLEDLRERIRKMKETSS
jgi:rubrerythrin